MIRSNKNHLDELRKLKSDNTSGSENLLYKINNYLKTYFSDKLPPSHLIEELERSFDEFQAIKSYLSDLKNVVNDNSLTDLRNFYSKFNERKEDSYSKLFENAFKKLKDYKKFITLSNSSQVTFILTELFKYNNDLEVVVCESRPVFEGRITAQKLNDAGIKTSLITEAMIPEYVNKTDCVIIGSDKVLGNGNIINKVGSKLLAITAKYYNKPFIVITNKSKHSDESEFVKKTYNDAEIWDADSAIVIKNYYFEEVDKELFTDFISD